MSNELTAMEWGFRAHEKGMNLQMAVKEFQKLHGPLWRSDRFTDEERDYMAEEKEHEISDCVRELAHEALDEADMIELISYVDLDTETTAGLLHKIKRGDCCMADYESGEHEEHRIAAALMRRFDLVTEDGNHPSPLGQQYMEEHR